MKQFTLDKEFWLPKPRDEVRPFFADAHNLQTHTPPWLKFDVQTPVPVNTACERPRHGIIHQVHAFA